MAMTRNITPDAEIPFKFQVDTAARVVKLFLPPLPTRPSPFVRIGHNFIRIATGAEHGFLQLQPVDDEPLAMMVAFGKVHVYEITTEGQVVRAYEAAVVR